jgi:hypothetical protein
LWYLVGLIASDGCLSKDRRHIDITSADYDYLNRIKSLCGIKAGIGRKKGGYGTVAYHIQMTSRGFYDFLMSIGLTPKKSKTIRNLDVPQEYFADFLRGEIDGDGSIRNWIHPGNGREQWSLRIVSASRKFLEWIQHECEAVFRVRGKIHKDEGGGYVKYVLKYGKLAAQVILSRCYWGDDLVLPRKARLACECVSAKRGWKRSKTIE